MMNISTLMAGNDSWAECLPRSLKLAYYIFGVPLSVVLIVSSILLIAALSRCVTAEKLNLIACNVALCDLLLGMTLIMNVTLLNKQQDLAPNNHITCTTIGLLEILPALTSFMFLTLVHADRYLAVCVPTVYPDLWTTRRVVGLCVAIWIWAILFSALGFAFDNDPDEILACDLLALPRSFLLFTSLLHILPCCIINTVLYLRITFMLKVHQRKIQVTNTLTYSNLVDDTHLAKLFYLLVMISAIAWFPFIVSITLWFCRLDLSTLAVAVRACLLFGNISGFKVVVYMAQSSTYRTALKKLFRPRKIQESSHNIRGSSGVQ